LRVAYRASREGPRDIVFVANWFTCCEILPELPSTQRWVEAMTSLGRLIFFDQPEPWRESFQEIHEFLNGHQAEVADDRVLATVLFTDIVDSTRRAAEIGDRDWHALLDAHDAVVRAQLTRFRGREVNTAGDGFLAMFDGPQRAIRCAMSIRDAARSASRCAPGCTPASARSAAMTSVGSGFTSAHA
jgi:hypothetical protein